MALDDSFALLSQRLAELNDAVEGLRVMLAEDRPRGDDVLLFDLLGDALTDGQGWLGEALATCRRRGESLALEPSEAGAARRELAAAQERFERFAERLAADLCSYERLEELCGLARERGDGWPAWADGVRRSLAACERLAQACNSAFFACWREVAARTGGPTFEVHNTNVGPWVGSAGGAGSGKQKSYRGRRQTRVRKETSNEHDGQSERDQ